MQTDNIDKQKPFAELELSETALKILSKAATSTAHFKVENNAVLCGLNSQALGSLDLCNQICKKLQCERVRKDKTIRLDLKEAAFLFFNVTEMASPNYVAYMPEALYATHVLGIKNYRDKAKEVSDAIMSLRNSLRCMIDELSAAETSPQA